jgi:hypothetical protein
VALTAACPDDLVVVVAVRDARPVLGLGAEAGVLQAHDLQRGTAVIETVDGEIT